MILEVNDRGCALELYSFLLPVERSLSFYYSMKSFSSYIFFLQSYLMLGKFEMKCSLILVVV